MKVMGVLDRYVLKQWIKTFMLAAIGVPAVAVLIHLAERFGRLTTNGITIKNILLGELFYFPPQIAILLPAAVLFATVFTLNSLGRHSELTAVKAGGVSFLRLAAPMLVLATIAVPVNFALQEAAAVSSVQQHLLHGDKPPTTSQLRHNAAFDSDRGWRYGASMVYRQPGKLERVLLNLPKTDSTPEITVTADTARWWPTHTAWKLHFGTAYIRTDSANTVTIQFSDVLIPKLSDPPSSLMDQRKKAEEMTYNEFRDYLDQLKRSSIKPGQLEVDLYLKIALPVACLVVALFGAPLAVTNPRSGAALGLAMALGTTLVYLTGIQIMKAIGGKGIISPIEAAWSMNVVFFILAIILLFRVRS